MSATEQLLDDSDCSENWSLPDWPGLEYERLYRKNKKARLKRRRQKKSRRDLESDLLSSDSSKNGTRTLHHPPTQNSKDPSKDALPAHAQERGQWSNPCEFLLSIIAMSVGLGTFYRFPFVAYKNGGGAFLIPYIIVVTVVGRPLYLLELAIGQFCSYGQVKIWDLSPFFRGVGYGSAIASFYVLTYYIAIMGTTFYYLFYSFQERLPWSWCDPEWAGKQVCEEFSNSSKTNISLPQLYFEDQAIGEKSQIDDGIGNPQGAQSICLLISWLLIYVMVIRGVQSSGKASYITAIYPFVVIFLILFVVCTKPGAGAGMLYFLTPVWGKMLDIDVWFAAVGQCFFSLAVGYGPIINYASFNPFNHNIYRDALVISFMDTMASCLSGLTVFATLGTISYNLKRPIEEVVADGPGLVFITFSSAITDFDGFPYGQQIMAVLFFTMILTLAAGSGAACQLAAISVICDDFPKFRRFWVTLISCVVGFLLSLIYVTPGGHWMGTLVDYFAGNLNIYMLCILECVGINWAYGTGRIVKDLEFMLGRRIGWFWRVCWQIVIPVMLIGVLIYSLITAKRLEHKERPFPVVAIICGWALAMSSLMAFPVCAGYEMYKRKGSFMERLLATLKPTDDFGPRNPEDREKWKVYKEQGLNIDNNKDGSSDQKKNNENDDESAFEFGEDVTLLDIELPLPLPETPFIVEGVAGNPTQEDEMKYEVVKKPGFLDFNLLFKDCIQNKDQE